MTSLRRDGDFLIRPIQSSDIPILARIATTEYFDSELNSYLCPRRHEYPGHVIRRFIQMITARHLDPRNIGFVAVDATKDTSPVGYAQFIRLGDDEAAIQLIAKQNSIWRVLKTWWFKINAAFVNFFWPDRAVDLKAMSAFMASATHDAQQYWDSPEMKAKYENRWHAQSVVVSSAYQRRGIGRRLMEEVLQRAQSEQVVVGLEASIDGEKLYRRMGFELRGPFSMTLGLSGGGIMMWTPTPTPRYA